MVHIYSSIRCFFCKKGLHSPEGDSNNDNSQNSAPTGRRHQSLQTASRSPTGYLSTIASSVADLPHGLRLLVGDIVQARNKKIELASRAETGTAMLEGRNQIARADALVEGQHLGEHGQVGCFGDPLDTGVDCVIVRPAGFAVVRGREDRGGFRG